MTAEELWLHSLAADVLNPVEAINALRHRGRDYDVNVCAYQLLVFRKCLTNTSVGGGVSCVEVAR